MQINSDDHARTWVAVSDDEISWVAFNDDYIVFHRPSGKTHLLNESSWLLITSLLKRPLTSSEIMKELFNDQELCSEDRVEQIDSLLIRLNDLGLVRPV